MMTRLLEVEACLMSLVPFHDAWMSRTQVKEPRGTFSTISFQLPLVVIFIVILLTSIFSL